MAARMRLRWHQRLASGLVPLVWLALPAAAQTLSPAELAAACRDLPQHLADRDVTYTPGVDVRGRRVAPADLPDDGLDTPLTFSVPLTLDMVRQYGGDRGRQYGAGSARQYDGGLPAGSGAGTPEIGRLEITGNAVTLNGWPVDANSRTRLAAICRELRR